LHLSKSHLSPLQRSLIRPLFQHFGSLSLVTCFVTSHMLHVWLRGAAVRTAADTFSPAAMSDPLEEAVRTGRHTAMLNLSKPCESLLKYEGGIMGHHHVGLCVCVHARDTHGERQTQVFALHLYFLMFGKQRSRMSRCCLYFAPLVDCKRSVLGAF